MLSRLLFAAARGARIQHRLEDERGCPTEWEVIQHVNVYGYEWNFRIRPDDLHLQYGPISGGVRLAAERPFNTEGTFEMPFGQYWMSLRDWLKFDECKDELHRSIFLLILAEALADEGL